MRKLTIVMGLMLATTIQAREFRFAPADTLKQDTVSTVVANQDTTAVDTAKVEKPKKETE